MPCTSVPNDVPETYDPFLKPLMDDLCQSFIDGFQVSYPAELAMDNYEPREVETVRILLLCWAADHPGQCEVGKFLNQGKCGCRICKRLGSKVSIPTVTTMGIIVTTVVIHGLRGTFNWNWRIYMMLTMKPGKV